MRDNKGPVLSDLPHEVTDVPSSDPLGGQSAQGGHDLAIQDASPLAARVRPQARFVVPQEALAQLAEGQ